MTAFTFGTDDGDFFTVTLVLRPHGESDYWDGNWIRSAVGVKVGGLRGEVGGDLRAEELEGFFHELRAVYDSLSGAATFETMERWLSLHVSCDRRGHIKVQGTLRDGPYLEDQLTFTLEFDQTFLRRTVAELARAVEEFPVVGRPG